MKKVDGYSLRGREFVGVVIKDSGNKTVTIESPRLIYLSKYERYEKRKSRIKVHVPSGKKLNLGDKIRVVETRPISKTKNFILVEVIK